jgi:hypothetical protein
MSSDEYGNKPHLTGPRPLRPWIAPNRLTIIASQQEYVAALVHQRQWHINAFFHHHPETYPGIQTADRSPGYVQDVARHWQSITTVESLLTYAQSQLAKYEASHEAELGFEAVALAAAGAASTAISNPHTTKPPYSLAADRHVKTLLDLRACSEAFLDPTFTGTGDDKLSVGEDLEEVLMDIWDITPDTVNGQVGDAQWRDLVDATLKPVARKAMALKDGPLGHMQMYWVMCDDPLACWFVATFAQDPDVLAILIEDADGPEGLESVVALLTDYKLTLPAEAIARSMPDNMLRWIGIEKGQEEATRQRLTTATSPAPAEAK